MSRTIQSTSESASTKTEAEEFVWPEFNPSPGYRGFIERLRLARLERGLSIADMSDEVGLTFRLAHEFENITAPLPFEWLEVWCETVGVPFEDFLAIYWADQREWEAALNEKEAREREAQADETNAPASEMHMPASVSRNARFFNLLRAAFARAARFFRSRSSTA